jgi:hypothetical protein
MVSIEGQIRDVLESNWSLAGTLLASEVHFSIGWYDSEYQNNPQVTVNKAWSPEPLWFGNSLEAGLPDLGYISHDKYFVDCWKTTDHDILGENELTTIGDMVTECFRILNNTREGYTPPLGLVLPLDRGVAQHETNRQPYIMHIQMLVQANYKSGLP